MYLIFHWKFTRTIDGINLRFAPKLIHYLRYANYTLDPDIYGISAIDIQLGYCLIKSEEVANEFCIYVFSIFCSFY